MSKPAVDTKPQHMFFEEVAAAQHRVLFLDYDGTIAPFCRDRHRAIPYPGVQELLRRIMTTCRTRVIVVSGRAASDVVPLLACNPAPEIWGAYGLECLHPDGSFEQMEIAEEALAVLEEIEIRLEREGMAHLIEVKLAGVALHWRDLQASEVLKIRTKAYEILLPLASQPGLLLSEFEGGVEIRLKCANKGNAVQHFFTELPASIPVAYLGDDASDEEAFRVVNGRGLSVLVRPKGRFTAAQLWLRPPSELLGFLQAWIRASGGDA